MLAAFRPDPPLVVQGDTLADGKAQPATGYINTAAFIRAVRDPEVVRQLINQGAEPVTSTPAEFAAFIASETERFGKIVKAVGARAE